MATEKNKPLVHFPSFVTVSEFASKRGVTRQAVYNNIKSKTIETEKVGMGGHVFIDWDKFKDIQFFTGGPKKQ